MAISTARNRTTRRVGQHRAGTLADQLADYLYARSSGHIGSLMTLINRGASSRATRTEGTGAFDNEEQLLDARRPAGSTPHQGAKHHQQNSGAPR